MNTVLRNTAVALGMTTVGLAWVVQPLLAPGHQPIYHWSGSPRDLFLPVFLDVLVVWLMLTLVLLWAQPCGRRRVTVWAGIVLFAPSIVLKSLALFTDFRAPHWFDVALFSSAMVAYLLLMLLWRPALQRRFDQVVDLVSTVLLFLAISGAVFLGQLIWLGWAARSLNRPLPLHRSPRALVTEAGRPRIIWIVLDELSYQQVYERRFPGLKLPAFDELAKQATVFSRIIPAGIMTEQVLPSLLTGEPVDHIRSSPEGQLSIHDAVTRTWAPFEQHDTVFQDALDAGYSTAIAGWWNPYCRIMPAVLDHCYWTSSIGAENGVTPGETVRSNMLEPVKILFRTGTLHNLFRSLLKFRETGSGLHLEAYRKVAAAADKVLLDPSADFVLLHLPIPHPAGIYNRLTGQFTTGPSTYIDNLALADRYLAHVRSSLEQIGEWNSSTVIVMGDHGWRTQLIWRISPGWTAEEESASRGGQFDDRPAYIIKLAGQQNGDRINLPFHALESRRLMDALILQKIRSAEELHAWVQQIAAKEPQQAQAR